MYVTIIILIYTNFFSLPFLTQKGDTHFCTNCHSLLGDKKAITAIVSCVKNTFESKRSMAKLLESEAPITLHLTLALGELVMCPTLTSVNEKKKRKRLSIGIIKTRTRAQHEDMHLRASCSKQI